MRDRVVRLLLVLMALSSGFIGLWALLAPKSFYDDFPGAGRHWVSADGPYNEHLVRDVGGLNLALTVVVVVAAIVLGRVIVQTAAVATLAFAIPHLAYHSVHTDLYATSDAVASIFSLAVGVVLPVVVLILTTSPAFGSDGVTFEQAAGDHEALYLVRALTDDHEGSVTVITFDRKLGRVAVAAVDAHRLGGDLEGSLGREQLGHPRFHVGPLARGQLVGRRSGEEAGRLQLGAHVGQLELDRLVAGDGHAEGLPLLGVTNGRVERGAGNTTSPGRDVDPSQLERAEDERQAAAQAVGTTEHGRRGNAVAVVGHLHRLDALVAELADGAAHGDAARARCRAPSPP